MGAKKTHTYIVVLSLKLTSSTDPFNWPWRERLMLADNEAVTVVTAEEGVVEKIFMLKKPRKENE